MLPLIDMNPGDESCIYSTLFYIKGLTNQMNIEKPSITFDQSLWVKSVDIKGFHSLMSFHSSVWTCMEYSNLAQLFKNVYRKITANQIMTRKVILKGSRCNCLIDSALKMIHLEFMIPTETNEDEVDEHNENLQSQVGMLNIGEVEVFYVM